jgi:Protein of unknown function (DUF2924)
MPSRQNDSRREALSRLPQLDIGELRELWCRLYKTEAAPHLSRELLVRAVAHRMQEVASGGPRLELQRRLRQIVLDLQHTGRITIHPGPQMNPGTRLMREWRGRTYEVLVLDDGFCWRGARYRSLSAIARQITGTAWSGPVFFGLRSNGVAPRKLLQAMVPTGWPTEGGDAAG